jgi:hypothetical protein
MLLATFSFLAIFSPTRLVTLVATTVATTTAATTTTKKFSMEMDSE